MNKVEIKEITPDMAIAMIDNPCPWYMIIDGRSWRRARRFADMMLNSEFVQSGECIMLNDRGELIDGRQRMMAVVMANKSAVFPVMTVEGDGYKEFTAYRQIRRRDDEPKESS